MTNPYIGKREHLLEALLFLTSSLLVTFVANNVNKETIWGNTANKFNDIVDPHQEHT